MNEVDMIKYILLIIFKIQKKAKNLVEKWLVYGDIVCNVKILNIK